MNPVPPDGECRFAYDGPQALHAAFAGAFARVVDPEVALSIADLGLVYGVQVREGRARVLLTMTSAACPVADVILDDLDEQLADALPGGLAVDLQLVWEPPWHPRCMSERARRVLGW